MKNLNELELAFPALEECEKQSTKGGGDDYNGWSWGPNGWGHYGQNNMGGWLNEVTIYYDGHYTVGPWSPNNGQPNPNGGWDPNQNGGGSSSGSGSSNYPSYNSSDPGNCVFDLLSYLSGSKSITGYSYSPAYFFERYASQNSALDFSYNAQGQLLGVNTSTSIMDNLMRGYFNAAPIPKTQVESTISSGVPVAIMLSNYGPNGEGHAVIVTANNGDGTYTIFNPAVNHDEIVDFSVINSSNFYIAVY